MRVLATSFPAIGHLHAVLPLTVALQRAGHEVCVATAPDLIPWAIACGVPARPVGPLVRTLVRSGQASDTLTLAGGPWPAAVMPDLARLVEQWRPDLVVHEEGEYAGVLAAARADLPCVTQSWAVPAVAQSARDAAAARLAPLWQRWAPDREPTVVGQLYVDACPPALQHNGFGHLDRVIAVRSTPFDGPPAAPAGWLRGLPRPAAYVTLGALPENSSPDLLATLAAGAAAVCHSVVVTTGPNDVSALGPLPEGVRAARYLPQSLVLPGVDVVVSHGGAGGTLGAVLRAVPHLVVPGVSDAQQGVAAVVAGIGAGLRADRAHRSEPAVAELVGQLLGDVRYELAAARVRDQIERRPTPDEVVGQLVDQVAGPGA